MVIRDLKYAYLRGIIFFTQNFRRVHNGDKIKCDALYFCLFLIPAIVYLLIWAIKIVIDGEKIA